MSSVTPVPKVTAGTISAAFTFVLTFLLAHYVFHGDLTVAEQSLVSGVSPIVIGFAAAWLKKNEPVYVADVDKFAAKVAGEIQKYQPEITALEPAVYGTVETDPRVAGLLRRLESIANALGKNVPAAGVGTGGGVTGPPATTGGAARVTVTSAFPPSAGFDPEVK